ncbi:MAG: CDP-diacylglycerol--glycerol-3-phosphate 3-phosphatidyltransferase [Rickettsiales bacterium]|jgi:CDP-diacylglycerol--glycerol-3-phosphate 3-phosphatidyltransferase|nr:CDP-diacylglycerol--glycerol-3-phosphate 3-phosphatidyltransferase [Rickettsiales bacterium]
MKKISATRIKTIKSAPKAIKRNLALALPNLLTYARILVIPIVCYMLYMNSEMYSRYVACLLFFLASITDYFDGYLSRKMKITSEIGRFLDPIADKLLVGAVLISMAQTKFVTGFETMLAAIIISREIFISGLREYLGGKSVKVPVSRLAKWKTAAQLFAIGFLIFGRNYRYRFYNSWWDGLLFDIYVAGVVLLLVACALTIITGWKYMRAAFKYMKE